MPRLYCEPHGREHEARAIVQEATYRQLGESVLIVRGELISGPWLCDECHALLARGSRARLLTAFPLWVVEQMPAYDLAYERHYFAVEKAEVAVYGAAWSGRLATARR